MEIRAYDPFLMNGNWPVGPARPVQSLAEGLAWADVISVNAPKVGPPMLGTAEFEQVKPRVIIVNTARGGIVDETALSAAIADGRVAAVGLDAFGPQPPPRHPPPLPLSPVALTPHTPGPPP